LDLELIFRKKGQKRGKQARNRVEKTRKKGVGILSSFDFKTNFK